MGNLKIINQNAMHFVTFTTVGWVDVFTRKVYKDILIENLKYCQENKGLIIFAYAIMSNHMHLIIRTDGSKGLSSVIRDFKSYSARKIIDEIETLKTESRREWMIRMFKYYAKYNSNNIKHQLWKQNNHPIELISPKWIYQKMNYIHNNPVVAGIVNKIEDYRYSSASNYVNGNGLIDIELIDLGPTEGYVFSG